MRRWWRAIALPERSAAGIIAKTVRDRLMRLCAAPPRLRLGCQQGYGSETPPAHLWPSRPAPHHRRSFGSVSQLRPDLSDGQAVRRSVSSAAHPPIRPSAHPPSPSVTPVRPVNTGDHCLSPRRTLRWMPRQVGRDRAWLAGSWPAHRRLDRGTVRSPTPAGPGDDPLLRSSDHPATRPRHRDHWPTSPPTSRSRHSSARSAAFISDATSWCTSRCVLLPRPRRRQHLDC
jgi:hypothetical protein